MAKAGEKALERALDMMEQAADEFDLGVEFVAREMATAKDNEFAEAYVAGMLEEAVRQLLEMTPAKERMLVAGEVQQMALLTAIEIGQED